MEDKKVKKQLKKIPDVDKNGDPIYKIADINKSSGNKPVNPSNFVRKMVQTDTCF